MHIPVLLTPLLDLLQPQAGQLIVDATFGAGGYTRAFLEAGVHVVAFDRDPDAILAGQKLVEASGRRLTLVHACFSSMQDELCKRSINAVDAVVFDLGVSSMQLDEAVRGFSLRFDGPLDMRMSAEGRRAADLVNTLPETDLANLLYAYGEERQSRAIARAICKARAIKPFTHTLPLAELIVRVVRQHPRERTHAATRSFQALRIAVNDELGELESGLAAAHALLKPGGVLAAVTFHSLEDRRVKQFLKPPSTASRHRPGLVQDLPFTLMVNKPLTASAAECEANARARSAKLRLARKT